MVTVLLDLFRRFGELVNFHDYAEPLAVQKIFTGGKAAALWFISTLLLLLAFWLLKWIFLSPVGQLLGETLLNIVMNIVFLGTGLLLAADWLGFLVCALVLRGPLALVAYLGFDALLGWIAYHVGQTFDLIPHPLCR